jgi:hypothetical protein
VETNVPLIGNRAAFAEYTVHRASWSVPVCYQKTTIFGRTYDLPFGFPPMGGRILAAYMGDSVRAVAAELNTIDPERRVADADGAPQRGRVDCVVPAYLPGSPEITPLVERAQRAASKSSC